MAFFKKSARPLYIAGPCSAESEQQLREIAAGIQSLPIGIFRAGAWKPRTRPGSFEGLGEQALIWLKAIKEDFNIPVAVEVASARHVELVLKYGIDIVWIGARTTVNPFLIQQIADAVHQTTLSVMIKNPVVPDIALWQGAIERFERSGITDLAAIHRGFSSYNASSPYRNPPNWVVPIELKRRRPDIMILCDPSHIAGNRDLVPGIAQKAMDMSFDGLIIETHINPDAAWSDAEQQVTPTMLAQLIGQLEIRDTNTTNMDKAAELDYLRQLMDTVDSEIIDLLARRLDLAKRMGIIKKECNMAAYSPERWREIVETRTEHGRKNGLTEDYIVSLYEKIHHESIKLQIEQLRNNSLHL